MAILEGIIQTPNPMTPPEQVFPGSSDGLFLGWILQTNRREKL
jgi:hypothetical protein